jgi:hypothetical protein
MSSSSELDEDAQEPLMTAVHTDSPYDIVFDAVKPESRAFSWVAYC